jgi:gliding motility-associated-like protein
LGTWSGPGVTGLLFNPNISGAGTHTLYHSTASSPSGLCPASSTIAAVVYSLAPPVIAPEGPFCNSSPPVKIKANPVGGYFGTGPWVDALGVFNPAFAAIGNNIVTYSVAAGPCIAYASRTIKVEKYVSADLYAFKTQFCKFDIGFDLSSVVQNPGGTWSGPGLAGSYFTPKNANIGNNNILLYVTQSETFDLCPDTSFVRIRVDDVPDVNITRSPTENGCVPFVVTFNNPSANSGLGEWTLGDGSDPKQGLTVSHTYTAPGTYSVVFNYQNDIGCKNQGILNNPIKVFETPRAGFSYSPYQEVTISDPQVEFINQTIDLGKTTYLWQIDNLYSLTDVNPVVIFPSKGDYKITLKATSLDGCISEVSDIIVVKPDFSVFVPSSFSPNFDGLNDVFSPVFSQYGMDNKTFDMEIFDRWGRSLYKTKDINTGWDGSLQNKGEPLKEDVYVYKIKYKDSEGKIYNKLGYLSLVK